MHLEKRERAPKMFLNCALMESASRCALHLYLKNLLFNKWVTTPRQQHDRHFYALSVFYYHVAMSFNFTESLSGQVKHIQIFHLKHWQRVGCNSMKELQNESQSPRVSEDVHLSAIVKKKKQSISLRQHRMLGKQSRTCCCCRLFRVWHAVLPILHHSLTS